MGTIDLAVLKEFEATIAQNTPGFSVRFKDESSFLKLLGFLAYPFNPKFMTHYATTLGKTVWFPSRTYYEGQPAMNFGILAHELVHISDEDRQGFRMPLGVIFPQALGLIPFLLYVMLGWPWSMVIYGAFTGGLIAALFAAKRSMCIFAALFATACLLTGFLAVHWTGWLVLLLVAGAVGFSPWPAPFRVASELRGYAMQLGLAQWITGKVSDTARQAILHYFVSSDYYFMSWSRADMTRRIDGVVQRAQSGELQKEEPYAFVHKFCADHGLLANSAES